MDQKESTEIFVDNQADIVFWLNQVDIDISKNCLSWQNQAFQYQAVSSKRRTEEWRDKVGVLQNK